MKTMSSQKLREVFLNYFKKLDHTIVPSSPLVPANDPTLLFTNAGMVQFKDIFLGLEPPSHPRAVSVQRCMRAGGKHNDLENVGHTRRHHTFFEMLGNFSFGDYFKREAIRFAWNFLTQELNIPAEKLWVTVYKDDPESEHIWLKEMRIDPERFTRCGEKDNFWAMGDTGPCGPCTEIFFDHGPSVAGGPPGSPDSEGDRYVEIWNLVFMQYDRDISGKLQALPKPCVDTGMGLERIAAVMQGVHDNYDIDTFRYLLNALGEILGRHDNASPSMRVIVDHIRSSSFLIADGVAPSNEGRGYVLRRIIRRAIRHGYKLGQKRAFFYRLAPALVHTMGEAYPELVRSQSLIEQWIQQEEEQFSNTLEHGLKVFDEVTAKLESQLIPGAAVFQLYDTFGFPVDLTADLARERGFSLDQAGFEECMARQRQQSQQFQSFKMVQSHQLHIPGETQFIGYTHLAGEGTVTSLWHENKPVDILEEGQRGAVVLDTTPFYAESGGQVGDTGYLHFAQGQFKVEDTQKHGLVYLHYGRMISGKLHTQEVVHAQVDSLRQDTMLNHSATHLLHEALRRILGEHVLQKGSLVAPSRLRFDFSHPKPLTPEQIRAIEDWVNQAIRADVSAHVEESTLDEARKKGAMALFGEKYGDTVRVITLGHFSQEVCGGTHVSSTGQIGIFKIIGQSALAAGVRRVEAVTGAHALTWVAGIEQQLDAIAGLLKVEKDKIYERITQILNEKRVLEKNMVQLEQDWAGQRIQALLEKAVKVGDIAVLALEIEPVKRETMRYMVDQIKQRLDPAVIVFATIQGDKVEVIVGVTKRLKSTLSALKLCWMLITYNGSEEIEQYSDRADRRTKQWGRDDLAEGICVYHKDLFKNVITSVPDWVRKQIESVATSEGG